MDFLFVYGTLRSDIGHPMHAVLERYAQRVGMGTVTGRLFNLGHYPGLVLDDSPGPTHPLSKVWGEVYRLPGDTTQTLLGILDEYEDYDPSHVATSEYRRAPVQVHIKGKIGDGLNLPRSLVAWAYVYNQAIINQEEIASGDYAHFTQPS